MSRFPFIALLALLLLWPGVCTSAATAPMIGATAAMPGSIVAGAATVVTVTAAIADPSLLPNGVNLLRKNAGGKTTTLGVMHDDGLGGDAVAGDHVYTLQVTLNESQPGTVSLIVSAAFKGKLNRVQSAPITVTVTAAGPTPLITDFNPKSAGVGDSVTISGSNLVDAAHDLPHVLLAGAGGGTTEAPVTASGATAITFTVPVGAATGTVTVKEGGQNAVSTGTLTITSATPPVLNAAQSGFSVIQGQSAGYTVSFGPDPGFTQLAALSVAGLPAGATGSFSPPSITSGEFSLLTVTATPTQTPGDYPLSVTASATINGVPQSQTISVTLHVLPLTTSFIGRTVVDDALETPLAGVTVTFLGRDSTGKPTGANATTVSDASGNFQFTNLPASYVGNQLIGYDGLTATAPAGKYAGVNLSYTLAANQVTTSPVLIHLPRIDNAETVMVQQNAAADQTFTFKAIPNLSVTVYAGTTFTLADGSQPNPFPLIAVQVPVDRLPDTMPQMQGGVMPFIVAFQPANTVSSQPVAVTFPNTLMTPPGTDVELSTLDPTKGYMVQYGTGMVTPNGTQIVPDPDSAYPGHAYGLVHFDWHGPVPPPNPNNPGPTGPNPNGPDPNNPDPNNPDPNNPDPNDPNPGDPDPNNPDPKDPNHSCTGDPLDLASGIQVLGITDLFVSGPRGSLILTRNYRTFTNTIGPFGLGGSHNYNYRLNTNTLTSSAVINLIEPDGNQIPFSLQANGTLTSSTMPMNLGAVLTISPDNSGADLRWKSGMVYHFVPTASSAFRGAVLTAITDRYGNVTMLTRNPADLLQLIKVTDPVGRSLTFTYGNAAYPDLITAVTDPIGRTVQYSYTNTSDLFGAVAVQSPVLTSVTDMAGGVTQYTYAVLPSGAVALASTTDPRGAVRGQNVFDNVGRVTQQTEADGGVIHIAYTLLNPLIPTSPVMQTVVTDPLGRKTAYRFNPQGFVVGITDPSGQTTVFTLDPGTNQVVAVRHSSSGVAPSDFAATYDTGGNVLTTTDALGSTTSFTYEPTFHRVTSVTDPLGHVSTFTYDTHGNLLTATNANGKSITLTYNGFGQVAALTDPLGKTTALAYDNVGNLSMITDPLGHTGTIRYDAVSRPVQTTDALGHTSSVQYDPLGRVLQQTDPLGHTVSLAYDPNGNLLSLTDPLNHTTSFTYDHLNRLLTRTTPLGKTDTRQYDLAGNLLKFTDRRGQASVFTYDALNRPIGESYQDGSQVTATYDAYGRLLYVLDTAGGAFSYAYDLDSRLLGSRAPTGDVQYAYDPAGRRTGRQVAGQSAEQYAYDPANRLLAAAMPQAGLQFAYNDRSELTGITRANGVSSAFGYDSAGRLLSLTHTIGATSLYSQTYTYDAGGQRIASATSSAQPLITQPVVNTYDAGNRLLTSGATAYAYDDNGNLTSVTGLTGTTTYAWDTRGRLTSITAPSGRTNFVYDFAGNLLAQTNSAGNPIHTYLLDDLTNVIAESDNGGTPSAVLTGLRIDSHFAVVPPTGSVLYGLSDALNSTVEVTDGSGAIKSHFAYEPYGQTTASGNDYPFQYTGRVPISNTLYYYRARFYNPMLGRFISEDPIGFRGGFNKFEYVRGNPIEYLDSSGKLLGPIVVIVTSRILATALILQQIYMFLHNVHGGDETPEHPRYDPLPNSCMPDDPYPNGNGNITQLRQGPLGSQNPNQSEEPEQPHIENNDPSTDPYEADPYEPLSMKAP